MNRLKMLMMLVVLLAPLTGCTAEEEEDKLMFPAFSSVADDNQTYDNDKMAGSAYIVVFSAEWCNSPCYTTMHAIWSAKAELPVLVMSTDPAQNAGGYTLREWHDSANAHDDDESTGDTGVELSTYAFMKGTEAAQSLGITRPGSLAFVNAEGEITYLHEGRMDETSAILEKWNEAAGTV
ncbi:MAG: TlpA family protein disulfide reductase [Poseidonia sp.]